MSNTLDTLASKTAANYSGLSGNKDAALDPATIATFAELILKVIEIFKGCKSTPKAAADTAKSPGLFARMRLRNLVRDSMSRSEWRDHGSHVVNAILKTGETTTAEQFQSLYAGV